MIGIKGENLKINQCIEKSTKLSRLSQHKGLYGTYSWKTDISYFKKQRYLCKKCGQTFTAKTPYIETLCTISNDVKLMVARKRAKVVSEKDIAKCILNSPSTVHREINGCRVKTMNGFWTKDNPKYNKLTHHWKLLIKLPVELDRMNYHTFSLFSTWQSQYSFVQFFLSLDEELKKTYEVGHHILSH